jgi:hypothetical protein
MKVWCFKCIKTNSYNFRCRDCQSNRIVIADDYGDEQVFFCLNCNTSENEDWGDLHGNSVYYCCLDNCCGEKCVNRKKHGYFNDLFPEDLENFLYESQKQKNKKIKYPI